MSVREPLTVSCFNSKMANTRSSESSNDLSLVVKTKYEDTVLPISNIMKIRYNYFFT